MGLEKISRKKLTAVAFGGRQMTKTKAQQNYIQTGWRAEEGSLTGNSERNGGLVPRVLLIGRNENEIYSKYKRGKV